MVRSRPGKVCFSLLHFGLLRLHNYDEYSLCIHSFYFIKVQFKTFSILQNPKMILYIDCHHETRSSPHQLYTGISKRIFFSPTEYFHPHNINTKLDIPYQIFFNPKLEEIHYNT